MSLIDHIITFVFIGLLTFAAGLLMVAIPFLLS